LLGPLIAFLELSELLLASRTIKYEGAGV